MYPLNILFILSGLYLLVFCYNRYDAYRNDPKNEVVYRYFLASLLISVAILLYGLPVFVTHNARIFPLFIASALVINAIGFNQFLAIVFYQSLPFKKFVLAKFAMYLFVGILAASIVILPPESFVDWSGIFHFRFVPIVGWSAALQMDAIFLAIMFVLLRQFYRLKKLSIINSIALVLTFAIAGVSGSYLYVGDSALGLYLASVGLYFGMSLIAYAALRGLLNKN